MKYCALTKIVLVTKWLHHVAASQGGGIRGVDEIIDTKEVSSSFIDTKSGASNTGLSEVADSKGGGTRGVVHIIDWKEVSSSFIDMKSEDSNTGLPEELGVCVDSPPGWHDSSGLRYNCDWYTSLHCPNYGTRFKNMGKIATEACCSCEGGQEPMSMWVRSYAYTGGWRVEKHLRYMADVNGDGRADIVGFGNAGTYVSLSTGSGFTSHSLWVANYAYTAGGWSVDKHPRYLADVNGDGRADIVGFGNAGTYVSLSTGSGFTSPSLWVANYAYTAGGWRVDKHPRYMADVNGDGLADIVGFGNAGVYVSLSTGSGFTSPSKWVANYGYTAGGWRVDMHPRYMADVNGDGLADIVGFGNSGVYVSLSTGSGFTSPSISVASYGYTAGGWRVDKHPRYMADVNGDGRADVVGFGNAGVHVSLSTGSGFTSPSNWVANYGYTAGGWRVDMHPRYMADVNGDGRADIVGFGNAGVHVSLSTGRDFDSPYIWVAGYGYTAGGWRVDKNPRYLADVNGDGRADVVGFANAGTYVSLLF